MNLLKKKFINVWFLAFLVIFISSIYFTFVASDRYVSSANVVLESPQIAAPELSFSSLISGGASSGDMLLLRDYLLSVDMLKELMSKADFIAHYSDEKIDFFSRLNRKDLYIENVYEYYKKRISVELDEYSQVLRISVQAFDAEKAHQIANILISQGEKHMNAMGQRLAEEQVKFLEKQVASLASELDNSRRDLIEYQNEKGLISPTGTVESLSLVVADLESQLSGLRARKSVLLTFQSKQSPEIIRIENEIRALVEQIKEERGRMAAQGGHALNQLSSEYQSLELKAQFAQDSYSSALIALESTRIEAARKLKQVSILQSPTMPEYPKQPERLHNTIVVAILSCLIAFILNMLVLIVRDHRD
ncbi:MAG: hypothetical protein ACW7DQ_18410 [Paraglaciecola chathamensis]